MEAQIEAFQRLMEQHKVPPGGLDSGLQVEAPMLV